MALPWSLQWVRSNEDIGISVMRGLDSKGSWGRNLAHQKGCIGEKTGMGTVGVGLSTLTQRVAIGW